MNHLGAFEKETNFPIVRRVMHGTLRSVHGGMDARMLHEAEDVQVNMYSTVGTVDLWRHC